MGGPVRPVEVDWSIIFDLVAAEYGYTWEQFVGLTYKLLNACMENIARRTHNERVVIAQMHGLKMELYKKSVPIPDETLQRASQRTVEILKEKQLKLAKRGKR